MRVSREARCQHALPPLAFALRGIEETLAAMDHQYMHDDILRHLVNQGGIDKAHQRHMPGQIGIAQKSVHARAQREDRFQIGQGLHESRRRTEAGEIEDLFRVVGVAVRQHRLEAVRGESLRTDGVPARRQHAFEKDLWNVPACALVLLLRLLLPAAALKLMSLRTGRNAGWTFRAAQENVAAMTAPCRIRQRKSRRTSLRRGIGAGRFRPGRHGLHPARPVGSLAPEARRLHRRADGGQRRLVPGFAACAAGWATGLGRKPVLMGCVALFGVMSLATALVPTPWALTFCRFLTGLGIGGGIPDLHRAAFGFGAEANGKAAW